MRLQVIIAYLPPTILVNRHLGGQHVVKQSANSQKALAWKLLEASKSGLIRQKLGPHTGLGNGADLPRAVFPAPQWPASHQIVILELPGG